MYRKHSMIIVSLYQRDRSKKSSISDPHINQDHSLTSETDAGANKDMLVTHYLLHQDALFVLCSGSSPLRPGFALIAFHFVLR